jgi:hypothetical protein
VRCVLQHVRALRRVRDDVSVHCSPGVRAELPARIPSGNMAMLVEASCVVSGHPIVGQAAGTDTISHLGILCAATAASCNANDAHVSGSTVRQHNSGGGPLHVTCSSRTGSTGRKWRRRTLLTVRKRHTTDPFPAARAVNRGCCAYDWALPVSSSRQASSGGSAAQRPHKARRGASCGSGRRRRRRPPGSRSGSRWRAQCRGRPARAHRARGCLAASCRDLMHC